MSGRPWLKIAHITRPNENISLLLLHMLFSWTSGAEKEKKWKRSATSTVRGGGEKIPESFALCQTTARWQLRSLRDANVGLKYFLSCASTWPHLSHCKHLTNEVKFRLSIFWQAGCQRLAGDEFVNLLLTFPFWNKQNAKLQRLPPQMDLIQAYALLRTQSTHKSTHAQQIF